MNNTTCEQKVEQKIVDGTKEQVDTVNQKLRQTYIPIGNGKYIKVGKYNRGTKINIRDFTTTVEGRLLATKKGILLSPEEWKQLKKVTKEVDAKVKAM